VLYDYLSIVKNASDEAFFSVAEDVMEPQVYQLSGDSGAYGIDLPMYGNFVKVLSKSKPDTSLRKELDNTLAQSGTDS